MPAFPRAYSEVITHEQIMSQDQNSGECFKVADLSPRHFRKQSATKLDLNIGDSPGFGGLIEGQIYNLVFGGPTLFYTGITTPQSLTYTPVN